MSDPIRATLDRLLAEGIILCVRLGPGHDAAGAARAAARGGIRVLEITLTTPGAIELVRGLAREPELLVGGGTVLTVEEARRVAEAGGRFALSPVFDPAVMEEARRLGLLAIPGAATPAEILAAHRHGAPAVKVFPAGALGGPAYLRAVRGPLPHIPLIPTSGPNSENLADYMGAGAVALGVGAEVLHPGFTPASVEAAARKVMGAMAAWRAGATRN